MKYYIEGHHTRHGIIIYPPMYTNIEEAVNVAKRHMSEDGAIELIRIKASHVEITRNNEPFTVTYIWT